MLQSSGKPQQVLKSGISPTPITPDTWHRLVLTTVDDTVTVASINQQTVVSDFTIRNLDTGFAAFGTNGWFPVEFDNVDIFQAGTHWNPTDPCSAAQVGQVLHARDCVANGFAIDSQKFTLEADYTLRHTASGLCASSVGSASALVTLAVCNSSSLNQQFFNDYTRIRNSLSVVTLQAGDQLHLSGGTDGSVSVLRNAGINEWGHWVYFPNTGQLRNQYVAAPLLGYPRCLSTC